MLQTSINSDYNNDIPQWPEIEHQLKCIADAKFTHTSWIHDWDGDYMYSASEMKYARDLVNGYGMIAHTHHASEGSKGSSVVDNRIIPDPGERCPNIRKDYTSPNKYLREAGVDLLKNRIELCRHLGAGAMVLHMSLPYALLQRSPQDKEDYYAQVYKTFDEIQPYAKDAGVKIALENLLFGTPELEMEKFDRMFDRYDKDFLGLCYDSGHASVLFLDNFYILLEKYHDRLYATHLQDTSSRAKEDWTDDVAALRGDKHWIPFTGVVEWEKVAHWVARAPIDLPADFEVCLQYGTKYDDAEKEMADLAKAHAAAERFQQLVLDEKAKIK